MKTESKTGPKGVWGSCASRESLTPALRVFAKQIMKKKKKKEPDCFPVYIRSSASESRKKDVIYTETVYNNKSFDDN